MGEEEKKSEEKTTSKEEKPPEEKKVEGGGGETEKKEGGGREKEEKAEAPPPPPEEVVMRVYMHCEGCARKVKRCLKGFEGVEDVATDSKAHKVVVKGKKAAEDPMKVVDRVQKKTGRKVELLSPIPPPPPKPEEKKKEEEEKKAADAPKQEEKKEPQVITVVLKVHMHCEACAQEIKKRILKMKGVQSAEPNMKASVVDVKGTFDPPSKLVDYVYKRTGKHATIVKTDPPTEVPPADSSADAGKSKDNKKDDKKSDEKKEDDDNKKDEKTKEENSGDGEKKDGEALLEEGPAGSVMTVAKMERMLNELYQHYPRHAMGYTTGYAAYAYHQYPPQMFSDENPNACSVM